MSEANKKIIEIQQRIEKMLDEPLGLLIDILIAAICSNRTRSNITSHCFYIRDDAISKFEISKSLQSKKDASVFNKFLTIFNHFLKDKEHEDLLAIKIRYYTFDFINVWLNFKDGYVYNLRYDNGYDRLEIVVDTPEKEALYFLTSIKGERNVKVN